MGKRPLLSVCNLLVAVLTPALTVRAGPEWIESGDAGSLPSTAQVTGGAGCAAAAVVLITGELEGAGDFEDMYLIYINNPAGFSATTTPPNGSASFNTQLWLFNSNGLGVTGNDDVSGSQLSTLTMTPTDGTPASLQEGLYYLAISRFNDDPLSNSGPIFLQGSLTEVSGPDGAGGASPVTGWSSSGTGTYSIFLTGALLASYGLVCNDGLFCNGSDTCGGGSCSIHTNPPCQPDNDASCSDCCNESTDACTAQCPNGSACSDSQFCNGSDVCSAGICSVHTGDPCAAAAPCNNICNEGADNCFSPSGSSCGSSADTGCDNPDSCNGTGACLLNNLPNGTPCGDMGACQASACVQARLFVDDSATGANDGTSWEDAFGDLQDALSIAAANPGEVSEISVAGGTYQPAGPGGNRAATFQLINAVQLKGGYAGFGAAVPDERNSELYESILSGDLNSNDAPVACTNNSPDCNAFGAQCVDGFCIISLGNGENSYHVVTGSATNATAVLDGFTIAAGNANGGSPSNRGAGMYNPSGSPTVANCTFVQNSAAESGGGMRNSSSPKVTNCTFRGNSAGTDGGGIYNSGGSPTVTNCTFSNNSAGNAGGGMYRFSGSSSPTATNCTFSGNSAGTVGGGLYNFVSGGSTVTNCIFSNNLAGTNGGGVYNTSNSPTVTNCTFSNNSAGSNGGGMYNSPFSPTVTNCTFNGNSANNAGGGMYTTSGSPTLTNCVLWGNSDSGGMDESAQIHINSGAPVVNYSILQGGWTGAGGTGNSASDPLFVDPDGPDNMPGTMDDNFRVSAGSPAIDSGNNSAVPTDTTDLDGDGITLEPIPWDLDEDLRFFDDALTTDTGSGTPPIVDMGAYEFGSQPDCNGNGIPDADDIATHTSPDCNANGVPDECDLSDSTSTDCDANGIPDECDIAACPPLTPACDDCNLNGAPDECDPDADNDGLPDDCTQPQVADTWTLTLWQGLAPGQYPDNQGDPGAVPDLYVTINNQSIFLDDTVEIEAFRLLGGGTLEVTGDETGDFIVIQPEGILNEGNLLVGYDRLIDVSAGTFTVRAGGVYQAHPQVPGPVRATLTADAITVVGADPNAPPSFAGVSGPGSVILSGSMVMNSGTNLTLQIVPHKGDGTPPPTLSTSGSASISIEGDLVMLGAVELDVNSSNPLTVGGDVPNYITLSNQADHLFNWASTLLFTADSSHTIEAASEDRGPWPGGMVDNFAIGTLELAPNATVTVVDVFDNQEDGVIACDEALYIGTLILQPGSTLISDGCPVYYGALQNNGGVIGGSGIEDLRPLGDINDDSCVNALDLAQLLGAWGNPGCNGDEPCLPDLDSDGNIGAFDLPMLLGNWGCE